MAAPRLSVLLKESKTAVNNSKKTLLEIYDSLTDEQKEFVHYVVGLALEEKEKKLHPVVAPINHSLN